MARNFVARTIDILRSPRTEWIEVAQEPDSFGGVLLRYALPWLVVVGLVGQLLTPMFVDEKMLAMTGLAGLSMATKLGMTVFGIVWGLATFAVQAQVTGLLSKSFGGHGDSARAAQLASYSSAPHWLGSLFGVIPIVGGLIGILGLVYAIYLYAIGATPVMGVPDDRRSGFVVVSVLSWFIIVSIAGAISMMVLMPALFGVDIVGSMMDNILAGMATPQPQ